MNKIESLHIYPVKSCRGITVAKLAITPQGPEGDREWMLVDESAKFLSQRTLGKMAQVETVLDESFLTIAFAGQFFKIKKEIQKKRLRPAQVWSRVSEVHEEPLLYSEALSQFLGVKCFLVRWQPQSAPDPVLRFSDRAPVQILNLKSLEDLNSRLANPIGADRFRANIVYQGEIPFEEETWKKIKIGEVIFSHPQKCGRCKIINLDSKTGEGLDAEPLTVLSTYRREGAKINFGSLWQPDNEGVITPHDRIEVLA